MGFDTKDKIYRYNKVEDKHCVKTCRKLKDGRSFVEHIQRLDNLQAPPINEGMNEFYLYHGTSAEAALSITEADFRIDLAGSNAGSLYGRGVYFAEACTKSDEYAADNKDNMNPILVCRVLCGNVNYSDDIYPNPHELVGSCVFSGYHSVLGDREKCRGTYREFIV